jgi:hypothetical protein
MKFKFCKFQCVILFLLLSSFCFAKNFEFEKRGNSEDFKNLKMPESVVGHTYLLKIEAKTKKNALCSDVVESMYSSIFDESFPWGVTAHDYVFGCNPGGKGNYIYAQVIIEPRWSEDVEKFEKYMQLHLGIPFDNLVFEFKKLAQINVRKKVTAIHYIDPGFSEAYDLIGSVGKILKIEYLNYWEFFKNKKWQELVSFQSSNIKDLYKYLNKIFGAEYFDPFYETYLIKSNYVHAYNEINFVLASQEYIPSMWDEISYRACYVNDNGLCLAK